MWQRERGKETEREEQTRKRGKVDKDKRQVLKMAARGKKKK